MICRQITENDFTTMVNLGQRMHGESAYAPLDYDRDKCYRLLERYMANPDTHFAALVLDGDKPAGMFMGCIESYYFGNDLIGSQVLWYVDQEYRGTRAGIRLMRAFESWAKERGVSEIYMGVSSAVSSDRTGALLERFGYRHVGGNYKLSVVE